MKTSSDLLFRPTQRPSVAYVLTGLLAALLGWTSNAYAGHKITRLTPDFNPGSQPHLVNTALHLPIDVDVAPGNSDYYFVSQLGGLDSDGFDGDDITKADGRIVLLDRNTGSVDFNNPFLTIGDTNLLDPVPGAPEVGLFSTAFHPDFATNGKFYVSVAVNYPGPAPSLEPRDPRTPPFKLAVREYTADPNNIAAGATFSQTIFEIDQPAFNHNGCWMGFNPQEVAEGDNYLYVTLGDGGNQHDPYDYSQDKNHLLGSVLRIDIDNDDFVADADRNYAIPADNPFVGTDGADEIWAYGLRNPWRAGFDSATGDLYIGDVGQATWEEINYLPGDISPSDDRNFGWRLREGFGATPTGPNVGGRPPSDNVDPLIAYLHGNDDYQGDSVAAGLVYRGPVEEFYGMYIFADSLSGNIWGFDINDIGSFDPNNPGDSLVLLTDAFAPEDGNYVSIVSFAEDEFGNLLIVDHGYDGAGLGGHIYRLDFVLSGDYNDDGVVNAADYTVWRNNIGAPAGTLPNDTDGGVIGADQYNTWKANFGDSLPVPGAITQVPEAATLFQLLIAVSLGLGCIRTRRRTGRSDESP
ncbi:PQQ-dependent sugar dehydrogenase [Aeoliella sp.]|uniref:PQQ-dependent sugar dehydrogenase n=1 Tax=Aeoliella sp. TaxID=2795800 RepID=UPI003CCBD90C